MYQLLYMRADFEPWWMLDGWEDKIVKVENFDTLEQCERACKLICDQLRLKYENEQMKDEKFYAFWSEDEVEFCEACDEDLQIYHGVIICESQLLTAKGHRSRL